MRNSNLRRCPSKKSEGRFDLISSHLFLIVGICVYSVSQKNQKIKHNFSKKNMNLYHLKMTDNLRNLKEIWNTSDKILF